MSSRQVGWCVVVCALAFLPAAATLVRAEPVALAGQAAQAGPIQLVALTPGLGGDPGIPPDASELDCLALNIYWEARSEPRLGQIAVAAVTLNRVADPGFPDTVCGVVRQGEERGRNLCQFSWHCDGLDDRPRNLAAWEHAQRLARLALAGQLPDPTGGALWFHSDQVHPDWTADMTRVGQIGTHIFYRLAVALPSGTAIPGPPDLKPSTFASTSGEPRPVTAIDALPVARPLSAAMPASPPPVAETDTSCSDDGSVTLGQGRLAMALAVSTQQNFLSLVEQQGQRIDGLPCQDEAAGDAPKPRIVLVSDVPEGVGADTFEAILPFGARSSDAGAAIAEPGWPGGSFGAHSGRGGGSTHQDAAPTQVVSSAAGAASRSVAAPSAPPADEALSNTETRRPERGILADGIRVAQAAAPHLPALTPASLLGPFEPPALPDRQSPRAF